MIAQVTGITVSLAAGGAMAGLSILDVPQYQAQPASRSLPSLRWMFSRGSHIFPPAAVISSVSFGFLASIAETTQQQNGYIAAALLSISVYPIARYLMVPTNFRLMKINEEKGGARSKRSAETTKVAPGDRSAEDTRWGKGEAEEFRDDSGPQEQTEATSKEEDEEVRRLLGKFASLNSFRAAMLMAGGVVGLIVTIL